MIGGTPETVPVTVNGVLVTTAASAGLIIATLRPTGSKNPTGPGASTPGTPPGFDGKVDSCGHAARVDGGLERSREWSNRWMALTTVSSPICASSANESRLAGGLGTVSVLIPLTGSTVVAIGVEPARCAFARVE